MQFSCNGESNCLRLLCHLPSFPCIIPDRTVCLCDPGSSLPASRSSFPESLACRSSRTPPAPLRLHRSLLDCGTGSAARNGHQDVALPHPLQTQELMWTSSFPT